MTDQLDDATMDLSFDYAGRVLREAKERPLEENIRPIDHLVQDSRDAVAYLADFEVDFFGNLAIAFQAGFQAAQQQAKEPQA